MTILNGVEVDLDFIVILDARGKSHPDQKLADCRMSVHHCGDDALCVGSLGSDLRQTAARSSIENVTVCPSLAIWRSGRVDLSDLAEARHISKTSLSAALCRDIGSGDAHEKQRIRPADPRLDLDLA
jgi:hypothetical protein